MDLREEIAKLPFCSRDELAELWKELFDVGPPGWIGRKIMLLAIAHRMQERARGIERRRPGKARHSTVAAVRPGTKFIREWRGELHVVMATDEGFMWQGKCYKSLSVIARTITGMRWSGPIFFGLKGKTLVEAEKRGIMGKTSGDPMCIGAFRFLLRNPIYIGKIRHKELVHPGQHEAILDEDVFRRVQAILDSHRRRTGSLSDKSRNMLVSMIEDEDGRPITPTHTVKNGKRYHYYVSNALLKYGGKSKGWRIPAHDIETLVVQEVRRLLWQPAKLSSMVLPPLVPTVLERAKQVAEGMAGAGQNILLRRLVKKVVVEETGVRIHVSFSWLCETEDLPDHVLSVEVKLRRCGRDMRLVLSDGMPAHGGAEPDPALIKVVERAEGWFDSIAFGDGKTVADLARREGVSPAYIKRLLPMAFLAPDIRAAIMEGKQPAELSAQRLTRLPSLPLAWEEQRRLLGFAGRYSSPSQMATVKPWLAENSDQFASALKMLRI